MQSLVTFLVLFELLVYCLVLPPLCLQSLILWAAKTAHLPPHQSFSYLSSPCCHAHFTLPLLLSTTTLHTHLLYLNYLLLCLPMALLYIVIYLCKHWFIRVHFRVCFNTTWCHWNPSSSSDCMWKETNMFLQCSTIIHIHVHVHVHVQCLKLKGLALTNTCTCIYMYDLRYYKLHMHVHVYAVATNVGI